MEWVRGNADVDSSHSDGTYHGGRAAYFTSFMWSPLGGPSLAEKGLHEGTPYRGTSRLPLVRFVVSVVSSDGTSIAPNKKEVRSLHFK